MKKIMERLFKYVEFHTTSDSKAEIVPSTENQRIFAEELKKEMISIGIEDVVIDKKSFLMAKIPSNMTESVPTVGFIAHLDTAPDAPGKNIKPKLHANYQGGIISISDKVKINPEVSKDLNLYIGHDIVTSDGTTLLGGDDKGGIAAIMTAVEKIVKDMEIKHGDICIAFTPDEEIGEGGNNFDVKAFGADFAYTVDGETMGEFNYETFNAAEVIVKVNGHNVHPGNAKGKMVNASDIACELAVKMPAEERPEYTEGYDGFFHLCEMKGSVEYAELIYILRDFCKEKLEKRKVLLKELVLELNNKYGKGVVEIQIKDEYSNMKEIIEQREDIMKYAKEAYEACGIEFNVKPIRGGTDGSKLSFRGLPCPNIFVGGNNFHSVGEFLSVQAMEKASDIVVEIVKNVAKIK